ncbi:glycosyltransferase [Calycomorphotria hydatis]|uniref:N-acetylgalactosamine-N, N'-diacetylbacillosaminyl-diphospho-undecaprenol 4-alpha-N-acetylgalactosaminyltransferase n=1 Tax=Calycomorphotria hydatis TaxID=2528027 RepID=A0A517T9Q4_9PLAN|nr:glycosyltransferase [Calycomorphotria hydatis]QDT65105.1 N-acetylgalactosamine-N,N'-diacetylbacillosaminyl-diphospho-undecaprenol 4-alpha-N-acetylgalactosaminyltransferase [Calycomorphotria hydatis]
MSESRIKVLFAYDRMDVGGSQRQILTILQNLDRERFEPFLYLIHKTGPWLDQVPDDVTIEAFSDPQGKPRRWIRGLSRFSITRDLIRVIKLHEIDVLYDRTFPMTMLTAPATTWTKTPRISAVVDLPDTTFASHCKRAKPLFKQYSDWAYRSAALVTANSECLREKVISFHQLNETSVVLLPNLIDFEEIDRRAGETTPLPMQGEHINLITIGRLHPNKGHRVLLEAFQHIVHQNPDRPLKLHIVGEGPIEGELKLRADELGIDQQVLFHGVQVNPLPWLRAADLFCFPSLQEGLPNALIEAVACRVPVISTNCDCGPSEILDDGRLGSLVPVNDAVAMSTAIQNFLDDPSTAKSKVDAARQFVEEKFGMTNAVGMLEEQIIRMIAPERS